MENQINPLSYLTNLSVAEQQIVAILKAVSYNSKIIILDEPTASLTTKEVSRLFEIIKTLKRQGIGFIVVSHRFKEIFEISDRISVLRDGSFRREYV
jgi:ABC-type sugar transport system ATPase subunit